MPYIVDILHTLHNKTYIQHDLYYRYIIQHDPYKTRSALCCKLCHICLNISKLRCQLLNSCLYKIVYVYK